MKTFCPFLQVRETLKVEEHAHYSFTPRHLTTWALSLMRYEMPDADFNSLVNAAAHEVI